MEVIGVYNIKQLGITVSGRSLWKDNISHKIGDIIYCGDKKWEIIAMNRIHQGCFGIPKDRWHGLTLEPIGHDYQPNVGDELI